MFVSGKFRCVDFLLVLKLESFDPSVKCPTKIFTICVTILHRAFRRFVRFGFGQLLRRESRRMVRPVLWPWLLPAPPTPGDDWGSAPWPGLCASL